MNDRFRLIVRCLTLIAAVVPFFGSAEAQRRPPHVPRMAVMVFQSDEPGLGVKAADMLRERIENSFNSKDLYTVPAQDNNNILEQSGYDPTEPLGKYEEASLAGNLRADEYIGGKITRTGQDGPYRVEAYLMIYVGRENQVGQPLPVVEDKKLGKAMDLVRDAIRAARKQLEGERECRGKSIVREYPAAIAAGRKGIAEYPQATLARMCVADAQYKMFTIAPNKADSTALADSALVTVRELLQFDSLNVPALKWSVDLYKFRGDTAQARRALLTLLTANPNDVKLIDQVVNELAASGYSKDAVPYVKDMIERNPGDPQILKTAFLVYLAADENAAAVEIGPELIRADSTAADESYYLRMGGAYVKLDQPQRAAAVYAEATAKFPNNPEFEMMHYQALEKAGQLQQAAEVLKRAAARQPGTMATYRLAKLYADQKMPDSVYAVLQTLTESSPDSVKKAGATLALQQANLAMKAAQEASDSMLSGRGIKFGQLSDRLNPSGFAKFMIGANSLLSAQFAAIKANPTKSCPLAQSAQEHLNVAKASYAALASDPQVGEMAAGSKASMAELGQAIEAQVKAFCK